MFNWLITLFSAKKRREKDYEMWLGINKRVFAELNINPSLMPLPSSAKDMDFRIRDYAGRLAEHADSYARAIDTLRVVAKPTARALLVELRDVAIPAMQCGIADMLRIIDGEPDEDGEA